MTNFESAPRVPLSHLDDLWFQVTGTVCNLTCQHCFISCSPHNHSFGYLTLDTVRSYLEQSIPLGVKEYYFTGGEPFLHPQMVEILIETLRYGPATVLTNGTVIKCEWLARLAQVEADSLYSLELRVSIDGFSAATNDPIRGLGTFERAMRGVGLMVQHGFLPIITAARTWPDEREIEVLEGFRDALRGIGYARPRIKILPTLRLGAEAGRTRGYEPSERVTPEMMNEFDLSTLVCEHSRIVTDRGMHVCPILIEEPASRLGGSLAEAIAPYSLAHGACFTCYQYGAICSNPSRSTARSAR